MKHNLLKLFGAAALVSVFFSACIKDDDVELTDQGSTFIKLLEAPEQKLFFAPFTDVRTVDLFSVRKDAATSAALSTPTPVKVTFVPGYIDRYNDANGTTFEVLPDSLFTTAVPKSGDVYDMSLASGQASKEFTIQLNGAKWDLAHTYAMAFYVSDAAGLKVSSGKDTVIALLSVINAWDGTYEVTGTMADNVNPALTGLFPMEYQLVTASPTENIGFDPVYWVDYFIPIRSGADISGYGSFAPVFEFDPATDKIISVTNAYGQPAGNTRSAELDPSGINKYFSDTKTIQVKFWMKQPSLVPAAPHIRVAFDWTMKYTGPR